MRKAMMRVRDFFRRRYVSALAAVLILAGLAVMLVFGLWLPSMESLISVLALVIGAVGVFFAIKQYGQSSKQTNAQSFNDAISMVTDTANPTRVRTGFTRLSHLLGESKGREVREYLIAAQNAAMNMLEWRRAEAPGIGRGVRHAALKFLMAHPHEDWENAEWENTAGEKKKGEWQLSDFDLSDLDLTDLLNKIVEEDATKGEWRVVASGSNCEKMRGLRLDFSNADLTFANLTGAFLVEVNLTTAILCLAKLTKIQLVRANLVNANLEGADLTEAVLIKPDLMQANLAYVNLTKASLASANLSNAGLQEATLAMTTLQGADLTGANLSGANLQEANLEDANLADADLSGARLGDVVFNGTRIDRADFRQTSTVRYEHGKSGTAAISLQALEGCCWDKRSPSNAPKLPEGIDPYNLDDCPWNDSGNDGEISLQRNSDD
ncbi:MAG: pentapeptide repeat-containing protein [Alphaproteobacteria bacterium]|nr:pentapeptide repeat-containing protein [Alphaproteobacteria bacterium]MDA8000315.1 pentapeptide repeat-containing protein [Alphaproteobacteria bacterium]MDA8003999.1 pentapeptide repeat-containing protein [Alphaproteobacteria bacterium]MDA8005386.1 pentapeptide repeat-containing protein [Alphaproteobacteria bacterium]MDA8013473.1 pentapeptide repeat-containing protein [Alphaproteobacteria bacterium]